MLGVLQSGPKRIARMINNGVKDIAQNFEMKNDEKKEPIISIRCEATKKALHVIAQPLQIKY